MALQLNNNNNNEEWSSSGIQPSWLTSAWRSITLILHLWTRAVMIGSCYVLWYLGMRTLWRWSSQNTEVWRLGRPHSEMYQAVAQVLWSAHLGLFPENFLSHKLFWWHLTSFRVCRWQHHLEQLMFKGKCTASTADRTWNMTIITWLKYLSFDRENLKSDNNDNFIYFYMKCGKICNYFHGK